MVVIISPTGVEALGTDALNDVVSALSIEECSAEESTHTEFITEKEDITFQSHSHSNYSDDDDDEDEDDDTFSDSTNPTIPSDIGIKVDANGASILAKLNMKLIERRYKKYKFDKVRRTSKIDVDDAVSTLGRMEELLSGSPEQKGLIVPPIVPKAPSSIHSTELNRNQNNRLDPNLDAMIENLTKEELKILYKAVMGKSMPDEETLDNRDDNEERPRSSREMYESDVREQDDLNKHINCTSMTFLSEILQESISDSVSHDSSFCDEVNHDIEKQSVLPTQTLNAVDVNNLGSVEKKIKLEKRSGRLQMFMKVIGKRRKTSNDQLGSDMGNQVPFVKLIPSPPSPFKNVASENVCSMIESHKNQTEPSFSHEAKVNIISADKKDGGNYNAKLLARKELLKYLEEHADWNKNSKKTEGKKLAKKSASDFDAEQERRKNETTIVSSGKSENAIEIKIVQNSKKSAALSSLNRQGLNDLHRKPPSKAGEVLKASDLMSKLGAGKLGSKTLDRTDIEVNKNLSAFSKMRGSSTQNQRGHIEKVSEKGSRFRTPNHRRNKNKNPSKTQPLEPSKMNPVVEIPKSMNDSAILTKNQGWFQSPTKQTIGRKAPVSEEVTMKSSMLQNSIDISSKTNTRTDKSVTDNMKTNCELDSCSSSSFKDQASARPSLSKNFTRASIDSKIIASKRAPKSQQWENKVDDEFIEQKALTEPLAGGCFCGATNPKEKNKWFLMVEKSLNQMFDCIDHTPEEAFNQMSTCDTDTFIKSDVKSVPMHRFISRQVKSVSPKSSGRKKSFEAKSTTAQSVPLIRSTRSTYEKKSSVEQRDQCAKSVSIGSLCNPNDVNKQRKARAKWVYKKRMSKTNEDMSVM